MKVVIKLSIYPHHFHLNNMKFQNFNIHSPAFRVQPPESKSQSPASRVQSPEPRDQHLGSSIQSPLCRVQRAILASKIQELQYACQNVQTEQKEGHSCNVFFLLSAQNKNLLQETRNSNLFLDESRTQDKSRFIFYMNRFGLDES